ncbi:MAG: hypothetical protein Q7I98_04430, partial [Erysipelotrichaceae bacterium]|nr:hypothetical protein [Erysipelotrichaceae bacterium]
SATYGLSQVSVHKRSADKWMELPLPELARLAATEGSRQSATYGFPQLTACRRFLFISEALGLKMYVKELRT